MSLNYRFNSGLRAGRSVTFFTFDLSLFLFRVTVTSESPKVPGREVKGEDGRVGRGGGGRFDGFRGKSTSVARLPTRPVEGLGSH